MSSTLGRLLPPVFLAGWQMPWSEFCWTAVSKLSLNGWTISYFSDILPADCQMDLTNLDTPRISFGRSQTSWVGHGHQLNSSTSRNLSIISVSFGIYLLKWSNYPRKRKRNTWIAY